MTPLWNIVSFHQIIFPGSAARATNSNHSIAARRCRVWQPFWGTYRETFGKYSSWLSGGRCGTHCSWWITISIIGESCQCFDRLSEGYMCLCKRDRHSNRPMLGARVILRAFFVCPFQSILLHLHATTLSMLAPPRNTQSHNLISLPNKIFGFLYQGLAGIGFVDQIRVCVERTSCTEIGRRSVGTTIDGKFGTQIKVSRLSPPFQRFIVYRTQSRRIFHPHRPMFYRGGGIARHLCVE